MKRLLAALVLLLAACTGTAPHAERIDHLKAAIETDHREINYNEQLILAAHLVLADAESTAEQKRSAERTIAIREERLRLLASYLDEHEHELGLLEQGIIPPEIKTNTTTTEPTNRVGLGTTGDDLITEDELILHAAEHTAANMSVLLSDMLKGGEYTHNSINGCGTTVDWDHKYIEYIVGFSGCGDSSDGSLVFHWTFGDAVYANGVVEQGDCRKLPGAGTKTTGEHRELTNDTDDPVTETINHSVEEEDAVENSLNESLELTNGQTIEAGGSVPGIGEGKATITFEQKFGIEHGHTESHTEKHSESVEQQHDILGHTIVEAIFTTDDSVTECALNIRSDVDWSTIDLRLYRHHCNEFCGYSHLFIPSHGRNWNHTFDGVDDLRRLATGHATYCDGCHFPIGSQGKIAYSRLQWPHLGGRQINFTGTRRTTVKDSASVIFKDVTGKDTECVHEAVTTAGTLESDLDDKLAAC